MAHSPQFDFDFDSDMDKLTSKIFSILENDFLFGHKGKVRILSIDAQGLTDGILAANSLCLLESSLQQITADPDSRIADYFDVAAGSGAGGILTSLLFARGPDGRPLSTARDALKFLLLTTRRKKKPSSSSGGLIGRIFSLGSKNKSLKKKLGKMSLKDTLKAILIPCYDLDTQAPFVFSRADAFESDAFDFKLTQVCSATTADEPGRPYQMRSVDKKTRILAGVAAHNNTNNPTAVAITHVLNNKQEFPLCRGLDDLLILSLGNGQLISDPSQPPPLPLASAHGTTSHLVDEAVSMAFAECRSTNYVRIQGNCSDFPRKGKHAEIIKSVDDMLRQKNDGQCVDFRGKKLVNNTNAEMVEMFAAEVIKEHQRRKMDTMPTVLLKQTYVPSPRTSSATTLSTFSSN